MYKSIPILVYNREIMKNIAVIFFFSLLFVLASFSVANKKDFKVDRIVIDAGHGGKDPGTHGELSKEKDIALSIALELGSVIEEHLPGVEVIYTRSDDNFIPLNKRADIANKSGADVFVSVHCNWISRPTIKGTEVYIMGLHKTDDNLNLAIRENSVINMEDGGASEYDGFDPNSPESYIMFSLRQNAFLNNSMKLASKVDNQFRKRSGRVSRGVKSAGFLVLHKTLMPSILVETGYLSNLREEKDLNDKLVQSYIASGIFRAFRDYKKELEATE